MNKRPRESEPREKKRETHEACMLVQIDNSREKKQYAARNIPGIEKESEWYQCQCECGENYL